MALVERLMRWGSRLGDTGSETRDRWITAHIFFAAQTELIANKLTAAQIKAYYNMTTADATEYDALVAQAPQTTANQVLYLERIHAVVMLSQERVPGYSTPAEVRAKLGL